MDKSKKITKRSEDFSEWYQDIIEEAGLAEHSVVRGSMVIKPYGYAIWENIQKELDSKFKDLGVENAYFPLFIPESFLKKEAEHVEGFSPELAVVTIAGGKPLAENLVVRPTSETIIYDTFKNWVSSHRDLPLLINQWANVVRWEMRPRMFLRTTEFLWQEGHTAHATAEEADSFSLKILELYKNFTEDFMAVPVFEGIKSESEKFAGAYKTYTIETIVQDGKAIQYATSHNLGQNFAKAFGIKFSNKNSQEEFVHQTSWGLSTRSIGALIMSHSDDNGLVLPPKIAPIQIVIIPFTGGNKDLAAKVIAKCEEIKARLDLTGLLRVKIDTTDKNFGEKNYYWEKRGVPLRIEVGPKDIDKNSYIVSRRDLLQKQEVAYDSLVEFCVSMMTEIQLFLFHQAQNRVAKQVVKAENYEEFKKLLDEGKAVYAFWDGDSKVEARIKEETKATIRCLPFKKQNELGISLLTNKEGSKMCLFAKSY
jgi:prolyl-tRNA synthetase